MYNCEILHLIQDALYRTRLIPDYLGYDDLRSIMLTMELVSKDDGKERSHLIVDFRIIGF